MNEQNIFPSATASNSGSSDSQSPTSESLAVLLDEFLNENNNLETTEMPARPVEALCLTCKVGKKFYSDFFLIKKFLIKTLNDF